MKRKALVLGATGLVGSELTKRLVESKAYEEVRILVRHPVSFTHPKLTQIIVNYDQLISNEEAFQVNDVFCCLGTTIKKAGSHKNFKKVDLEYPLAAAKLAVKHQVENYLIISATGANAKSRIFYSKVKGTIEEELKKLPLHALHIFRPSLLLGHRNEFRLAEKATEKLTQALPFLFIGPMKQYEPIHSAIVAEGMKNAALSKKQGVHIYESDAITKIRPA